MKRSYPTDLTDAEWKHIEPFVPAPKPRGRQRTHSPREILNAVFYVLRSGCPWRLLPREYPPWKTVYHYFRKWRINGTFERLNAVLRERLRIYLGRNSQPSAAIADSQSAKTTGVGGQQRGYDGGQKVRGRKRHILVDTEGLILNAKVHSAKIPEQDGLKMLLESARAGVSQVDSHLKQLWLDAGYEGRGKRWAEEVLGLSVVRSYVSLRSPSQRRWRRSGPKSGPRRARRSTGKGSCRPEASRCYPADGWWKGPSPGWIRTVG